MIGTVEAGEDRPILAEGIRLYRKRLGLSQHALAERTRPSPTARPVVSASTIGMIEMGRRGATLEKIDALAVALELNDDEREELVQAAGHGAGADPMGVIRRLDHVEEAIERVNTRLDELENHLDDLDRRLP